MSNKKSQKNQENQALKKALDKVDQLPDDWFGNEQIQESEIKEIEETKEKDILEQVREEITELLETEDYINLDIEDKMFVAYKEMGGQDDYDNFNKNHQVFIDLTRDAFCYGEGEKSREECYKDWVDYIKDDFEAFLYFQATDVVAAYT